MDLAWLIFMGITCAALAVLTVVVAGEMVIRLQGRRSPPIPAQFSQNPNELWEKYKNLWSEYQKLKNALATSLASPFTAAQRRTQAEDDIARGTIQLPDGFLNCQIRGEWLRVETPGDLSLLYRLGERWFSASTAELWLKPKLTSGSTTVKEEDNGRATSSGCTYPRESAGLTWS